MCACLAARVIGIRKAWISDAEHKKGVEMDRETVVLVIAQNGLKTAATTLLVNAALLEKRILATTDPKEQARLKKDLARRKKLASALSAADTGLMQYLTESGVEL